MHPIVRQWLQFLFGTPRRTLTTLGFCLLIFGAFRPDVLQQMIFNVLNAVLGAVAPILSQLIPLGIVLIGIGIVLRRLFRRGGGRRH